MIQSMPISQNLLQDAFSQFHPRLHPIYGPNDTQSTAGLGAHANYKYKSNLQEFNTKATYKMLRERAYY